MILQVWFKQHAVRPEEAASGRFHLIEVPQADFGAACAAIAGPDLIQGNSLYTQSAERGVRRIAGREPIAFFGSAVDRFQPPHWTFTEGGEA